VNFGATPGTSLVIVSDSQITVSAPAVSAGAVNVVVVTPAGTATLVGRFTYT
jgi:hypothetical protein